MKLKLKYIAFFIGLIAFKGISQDKYGAEPDQCKRLLSLFHESVKINEYDEVFEQWKWCFENCPAASLLIYSDGLKIANHKYDNGDKAQASALIDQIYEQRIKFFPQNLGKAYNDWALSLKKRGASEDEVYKKLEQGYNADPAGLSVKNLALFFQQLTAKNKATDVQKVFDTYDGIIEAVSVKIDGYNQELDKINAKKEAGSMLTSKETRTEKNNGINLRGLGQVELVLDQIIDDIATCERLIPLYKKNLESNKSDAVWLRRAASRMHNKGCTEDAFYPIIVEAYVTADPSPQAYLFYHDILKKTGQTAKAKEYMDKAVDLETDPYKKANLLYSIASSTNGSANKRTILNRAIKLRPSFGRAYLAIADLYAKSANSCGADEIGKRMVYVAALNKARMASKVDPSLTSLANKYIKNYKAYIPTKKDIFNSKLKSGDSYSIKCWIGETVKVPSY